MTPPDTARLAYLVPEFPGQTHVFFWREIEALEAMGVLVDIVSTTPPPPSPHAWAGAAAARTHYLARPGLGDAVGAVGLLSAALASRRLTAAFRRVGAGSPAERAKVLLAAAALAARSRRRGWRHVHVHSSGNSARVAMVAAALGDIAYSVTLHGPLADYGPQQMEKWRHAAFGLVITDRLRTEMAQVLGDDVAAKIRLAPMGIRLTDTERADAYAPWDRRGDAVLFSCGRLNPAKGHDTLIRAVSILVDEGVPVRLAFAGEDEQGGAGYRRHLEGLIDELGMGEHVRLLGAVGEEVVRDRLQRAHVFVLASRGEPLGVAIMEAMGAAVPVVVGDGGGVRELIAPGTGILTDATDARAIAAAVGGLLAEPEQARELGERARARVRGHFTSEASARVLIESIANANASAEQRRPIGP